MVQPTGSVQYVNPGLYNTCITEQQYNDMVAATAPAQSTQQQVTFGELCSRLYSMHKASVKMVEMPVTLAALYLINGGETTHHSHQFVPYATYPIIAEAFGEGFKLAAPTEISNITNCPPSAITHPNQPPSFLPFFQELY